MRWHPVHPHAAVRGDESAQATHMECALCGEHATNVDRTGLGYCAEHYRRVHPQRVRRLVLFVARGPSRATAVLRWDGVRPHRVHPR
jgi:hypothetical protein